MSLIYNKYLNLSQTTGVNLTGGDIKIMLVTSSYTPNIDTHQYLSDVTGELSGAGYTSGGITLSSPTSTVNTGTDTATFSASNPLWVNLTGSFNGAIIYKSTGTAATSPLIAYYNLGSQSFTAQSVFIDITNMGGLLDTLQG